MAVYAFWNNKGGTGKTSLAFQAICRYANLHPNKKVLAVDICPQANLSELFLGGLVNHGSDNLLMRQGATPRATIGGYFQLRLPSPYSPVSFLPNDFLTDPHSFNVSIPSNITLLCSDPLLELQSNAMSTLANTQIPGTNTWLSIIDWLRDFLAAANGQYDTIFVDLNPSFSIYTQIALAAADFLILPIMADDSSRRAIQNAFSLVYGLRLPSPIYAQHAFATKLHAANRPLPKVHLIAKNRITQYMGPASAYAAVLDAIEEDVASLMKSNPAFFSFKKTSDGFVEIRDFQTTGVVAYARGCPFYDLHSGYLNVVDQRVRVNESQRILCVDAIDSVVSKI
ncbi:MAG: ParA family protein [Pseudorhodoplanes sp.]|nr:MAG: ParA family protein [Pseudorhodoplanes sp.]